MLTIYCWFVGITGLVNLLGGPVIVALRANPTFSALGSAPLIITVAGFLSFSGVALIWAALSLPERAIIVFWEGVLRVSVAATYFAISTWPQAHQVTFGDGPIGIIYIIGLLAIAKVPMRTALFGQR